MKLTDRFESVVAAARARLGLGDAIAPDQVERVVDALDNGMLDDLVEQLAPVERGVLKPRQFSEVRPYSDAEWRKRHGAADDCALD